MWEVVIAFVIVTFLIIIYGSLKATGQTHFLKNIYIIFFSIDRLSFSVSFVSICLKWANKYRHRCALDSRTSKNCPDDSAIPCAPPLWDSHSDWRTWKNRNK